MFVFNLYDFEITDIIYDFQFHKNNSYFPYQIILFEISLFLLVFCIDVGVSFCWNYTYESISVSKMTHFISIL